MLGSFYEKSSSGDQLISKVAREALHDGLTRMRKYCHITSCRCAHVLEYFGETLAEERAGNCGKCDNCTRATCVKESGKELLRDVQDRARELLNAVIHCNQSYGVAKYVHFLRGTGGAALPDDFKKKAGYGKGSSKPGDRYFADIMLY